MIKEVKPTRERNPDYLLYETRDRSASSYFNIRAIKGATAIDAQTGETVGFIETGRAARGPVSQTGKDTCTWPLSIRAKLWRSIRSS